MNHGYSYQATLKASDSIHWRIEDIIGGDRRLDFTKPFMPESLARVEALTFLTSDEKQILNQIRGHEYLSIFGLVEEFILPFVLDHVREDLAADDRIRALLQFASEEAKHIQLFKRFESVFVAGFGTECAVIGPSEAIAAEVLKHDPLSIALLILQIEWMTQRHYLDSVRDNLGIEPLFASLLRHHWMEEAQHAKLDTLIVEAIAARMTAAEIDKAVDGYLEIGAFFDQGFRAQTALNLDAFERAVGRTLDERARTAFLEGQHQALRWTYLGSGMTHLNFLATLAAISPEARARVEAISPAFC